PGAESRRIVRVYNGVDPVTPAAPSDRPEKLGLTLLFVGRLAAIKNLQTLVSAAALAAPRVPGLQLWIVGDGPERPMLEALATELGLKDSITFWGERLDVAGFFSVADIFCMSSTSEGLPMSLLQAMSTGLPAITTDVGGMAEAVRIADAGFTTPVGDSAAMAEAIVQLALDENQRERFAENARNAYREHFTLEQMDASYMYLYERRR
ncbi:MAG TPA: glycosyltransferase family 4 protein, partial [Edaphobacter sp.]|nr:glycosyltransferase family 4 protein [Edaphobacter sp.]